MLGLQSIVLDWRWKFNVHVWMDATAGIVIGSRRRLGGVKHIDTVFLWVQAMVTEGKISLGKRPTKDVCRLSHETRRCCNDAKLLGWIGNEIPVRRELAHPESVILSADRDECCAETWTLVTDDSGNANSGGYSRGTGSTRHDELMESEF